MMHAFAQRLALVGAAAAVAFTAACREPHDPARDGTLVIALAGEPTGLVPPLIAETPGTIVTDQMFERLADPDPSLDIVSSAAFHPRLADAWTWSRDSLSIAFHIAAGARWHDGAPVTARDVRFTFDVYRDTTVGSPAAPLLTNIDSVQVRDDRTAVFWFHRRLATQFFDATYHMRILPRHLLASTPRDGLRDSPFARAPVGTGPFRFVRWMRGETLELAAAPRHRPGFDRLLFVIARDPTATLARALAGEVDVVPHLRADAAQRAARSRTVRIVRWASLSSGLILLNLHDPAAPTQPHAVFADRRVRRALTRAIDRASLSRAALGETATPAVGPLPAPLMRHIDAPLAPFDARRATALLDDAGWHMREATGLRQRAQRTLRFTLLVPTRSPGARRAAVIAQAQLRTIGVGMDIEPVDLATIGTRLHDHTFDAALVALDWDPSPFSARQLWGATNGSGSGDANFSGYRSVAFDAALDSAAAARDTTASHAAMDRAFTTLVSDPPAIWLYDLRDIAAVRADVRTVAGRPDAWWSAIAAWSAGPPDAAFEPAEPQA